MLRAKMMVVISLVLLLIGPGLVHSQDSPFVLFDVLPGGGHTVQIQWRMIPGMDTLPLEVERSKDKSIWERVASVAPDSLHRYSSADRQPGEGLIYYRVRQVAGKGKFLYTGVNWVQVNKTGKLYIWPNPANDVLHVKTPYVKGAIDIIDPGGKQILKIIITDFITEVPTIRLSKGIYFLRVRHENEILVEKFIKE